MAAAPVGILLQLYMRYPGENDPDEAFLEFLTHTTVNKIKQF